ncbi:hypothetical protein N9R90_02230, partial [Flavobacteriaceae bacterium]|nr:hypothetical protein [Flavobacteriaceae bacterium]
LYAEIQSLYDTIEEEYNSLVEEVSTVSIVSLSSENSLLYEQIDALSLQVEALTTQVNILTLQLTDSTLETAIANEQLQSLLGAQTTAASGTSSSTSSQTTAASGTSSSTSSQTTAASGTSSSTSSETTASSETQTSTTTDDSNSSLGNFQIGSLEFYNGNLYVGTHNKILKVDSAGNISTYLGAGGEIDIDIDIAGESDFITGLVFDNNGALYFGGDRTLRKLVGSQITTIYSTGVSTGGIVVNSNNDIFVPMCCANQTMRKIDQSGNVSTFINQGGNVYGVDIKGDIIYMAYSNGKIKTISSTNTSSNGPEELHTVTLVVDFLTSIKIDQSGNLYILNSSNNPNGKLIKVVNGSQTVLINDLWSTRGLDFDNNGNLYVGDMGRIHKVAPDGTVSVFINTRQ